MNHGFTKLFSSIVTSTIWAETNPTRIVWITMLALADREGDVAASVPGLARAANVSVDECRVAIAAFLSADPDSRTKTEDGRRIVEIDGGWKLLNYAKYRDAMRGMERTEYLRRKQAESRARRKTSTRVNTSTNVNQSQPIAESESREQKAEADQSSNPSNPSASQTKKETAEIIYSAYPRKVAKQEALKAITAALKQKPFDELLDATKAYAGATMRWSPGDLQFIPHPATWFNRGSYDDDRATWHRNGSEPARFYIAPTRDNTGGEAPEFPAMR